MSNWKTLATQESLDKTIAALKDHGITTVVVENAAEAKEKVFSLVPKGAEVMTMTSVTLETIGITNEINHSDKYSLARTKLMDPEVDTSEKQKLGAAPDFCLGSVHAVTEDGRVLVASNTGSQLPAYAYGSPHVVWVVGTQKIVKDVNAAMKRLEEYTLPLESERARKAYGVEGSAINKLLIINKEINPSRITLIFVKENLGY
ncbi:hypothetical protein A2631_04860 [Candidatus Daviesbacteria bacterium RIFCSPHIGHO2_01_FULL_44_29]|uniref:LUD domain-containing protein n=1 Tax=Candidatus Daviesbacteria bacterium RIFCSPHIGHO2_02_FULL_43_12 TaxID=1797776 RepID=A0A1F5KGJ8_9BACT|nr:MAG: hypothetical protein A2631_04860 [Candidatus Daviesbacteria bacterium RIFCSPHIGHO2_01_FULL_44_29]OGE40052.1 MAG: hypothetical protein A3D25_04590 [Candidatus Daviesbacteria bacterium RIFCSPHIGHO2_02_FULL_43_12]OGE41466.1 MAG: hypothetical protein A3E86_05220 [Candidatus Daviesbacteria bacterium RIFCSPHIGHO2_12_FULL_47_45]OGE70268.1 MAG: hypothetical protein A3B55_00980 [Candidatus Daviesbacteria bacterium RIFCSPLOWO2_01_FULL_43_15]